MSTIPSNYGHLTLLEELFLGNNFLTGNIPTTFAQLSYLTKLTTRNNFLQGPVPVFPATFESW
jgi:hypothetical protein